MWSKRFNLMKKQLFDFYLLKKTSLKSGQRVYSKFKNPLPIVIHTKFLRFKLLRKSGRSNNGRLVLWTRKSLITKNVSYPINYNFRSSMIGFFASVSINSKFRRFISMVILSSGSVTYTLSNSKHVVFNLFKFYKPFDKVRELSEKLLCFNKKLFISQGFFFINQLPRNKYISMLELQPNLGIQYSRSPGSFSKMTKLDPRKNMALIVLPSGVRKIFSCFSLGSVDKTPQNTNKYWQSNKAGYYSSLGKKPRVRGVARNPVDHPHGGRTKSINYPRTPWGLTTKYK